MESAQLSILHGIICITSLTATQQSAYSVGAIHCNAVDTVSLVFIQTWFVMQFMFVAAFQICLLISLSEVFDGNEAKEN